MVEFRYDSSAWRRIRAVVLVRDGFVCQIRGDGCTVTADQVDHIVPVAAGGALYALENLRGACARCNGSRGGRTGAAMANRSGPAGSPPPSREW